MTNKGLSLRQASQAALAAAKSADLEALRLALAARGSALAAGELPAPEDLDDGEKILTLLSAQVREVSRELARLRQFETGFAGGSVIHPRLDPAVRVHG